MEIEERIKEFADHFIAPNRRGNFLECVLGNAEYLGTIRINSSAIPMGRWLRQTLTSDRLSLVEWVEKLRKTEFCTLPDLGYHSKECENCEYNEALADIISRLKEKV